MIALVVLLVPLLVSIVICCLIFRTDNPRSHAGWAEHPHPVAAHVRTLPDARLDADSDALPDWTQLDDIQLDRLLNDASSGGSSGDR